MTTRDLSRLPKWAQDELSAKDYHIKQLETELDRERVERNKTHANSNVVLSGQVGISDVNLPSNSRITFYMNKKNEQRQDYFNGIEVSHNIMYPQTLNVQGYSGAVLVKPIASNSLQLILEKRF